MFVYFLIYPIVLLFRDTVVPDDLSKTTVKSAKHWLQYSIWRSPLPKSMAVFSSRLSCNQLSQVRVMCWNSVLLFHASHQSQAL